MFFFVLVAVILSLCCIYFYQKCRNFNPLPGPWSLPVAGNILDIDSAAPHLSLTQFARKYGPIYKIKLGQLNTVVVSDAQLIKRMLLKNETISRPPLYTFHLIFRNNGVTYNSSNTWKENRKFVANFLKNCGAKKSSTNKQNIEDLLMKHIGEFVQNIKKKGDYVIFESTEEVGLCIFKIMIDLLIGKTDYLNEERLKNMYHDLNEIVRLLNVGGSVNYFQYLRYLPRNQKNKSSLSKMLKSFYHSTEKIVEEKMQTFSKNNMGSGLIEAYFSQYSRESFNKHELQSLLFDIVGAASETTVYSTIWILLYLAYYKEVQEKFRQEVSDVLQGKPPDLDDLKKLPYTEAIIAEVARIKTMLPLGFSHYTSEDFTIDNFTIAKNTIIIPLLWAIHMDPNVWQDPEQFRPTRFLNDFGEFYYPNGSFLPFQTGKRICVGDDLARMTTSMFITNIVQNFKIESGEVGLPDLNEICEFTLRPKSQKLAFVKL